ncbi:hypothetical protein DFP72DRAFT_901231 [Ephemerocybe angulata]|uniref:Uncharacterized protein n=1 Tax=Ephemerocybe angulata TaxID=980116 RepID=A0A8H6HV01_9AGAR|nr:hypothetical protein DFP72DRAFT_901231 [Tulosesus angulatus]
MRFAHLIFGIFVFFCQVYASNLPGGRSIPTRRQASSDCETQCANWNEVERVCASGDGASCGCEADHSFEYKSCVECQLALPGHTPEGVKGSAEVFRVYYTVYETWCKAVFKITIPEVKINIPAGAGAR